jgi:hypothetical protein
VQGFEPKERTNSREAAVRYINHLLEKTPSEKAEEKLRDHKYRMPKHSFFQRVFTPVEARRQIENWERTRGELERDKSRAEEKETEGLSSAAAQKIERTMESIRKTFTGKVEFPEWNHGRVLAVELMPKHRPYSLFNMRFTPAYESEATYVPTWGEKGELKEVRKADKEDTPGNVTVELYSDLHEKIEGALEKAGVGWKGHRTIVVEKSDFIDPKIDSYKHSEIAKKAGIKGDSKIQFWEEMRTFDRKSRTLSALAKIVREHLKQQ